MLMWDSRPRLSSRARLDVFFRPRAGESRLAAGSVPVLSPTVILSEAAA